MWKRFLDESGATAIEYGIMCVLLGTGLIVGISMLGTALDSLFGDSAAQIDDAL